MGLVLSLPGRSLSNISIGLGLLVIGNSLASTGWSLLVGALVLPLLRHIPRGTAWSLIGVS